VRHKHLFVTETFVLQKFLGVAINKEEQTGGGGGGGGGGGVFFWNDLLIGPRRN